MGAETRILSVAADPDDTETIRATLETERSRFRVETATTIEAGIDHLPAVDCVVSDHDPPEIDVFSVLERVRSIDPEMPVVLFPKTGSEQLAGSAVSAGVTAYVGRDGSDEQYATLASRITDAIEGSRHEGSEAATDSTLRQIADHTDDVLFVVDSDWAEFQFVNSAYEDFFEESIERLRSDPKSFLQGVHPGDREAVERSMDRLSAGRTESIEFRVRTPDDEVRWVHSEGKPVFDDEGSVSEIVGFVRDITERVERTRRLETLIGNLPGIVYRCRNEPGWPMEYVKGDCEAITGYAATAIENQSVVWGEDVIHPDDRERVWQAVQDSLDAEGHFELTYRIRTADGETRWMWERGQLVDGRNDEPVLEGFITDITERKEWEEELEAVNTLLSTLFETVPVGVTVLGEDGDITRANERAKDVLGLDESDIVDRMYDDPEWEIVDEDGEEIPPEDLPFARVMATGQPVYDYRHGIEWPDKSVRWLSINAAPLSTAADDPQAVVTAISDITDQLENERALKRQNERLEEFASALSHDLRNPLNVASGRLELLGDECDSEHVEAIEAAHERMQTLIEDVLTLAREGDRVTETEPVALQSVIEGCWQTVDTDGAKLRTEVDRTVTADRNRLQQLLENLIRNAVEHGSKPPNTAGENGTDAPAVTIRIGPLDRGFYVEDDGPGIPPEKREDVFEAGYSTQDNGTGFGLSIVRRVAEAHGWDIRVTEGDNGGARFEITGVEFVE
ncbi:PAS domain S-box protein [Halorhabdus salina]|uniref:PAS domain S-box protein n=1 Tax=Halorhabdus salina TaxID=2750670 RepID=UPI0015EF37F8|nr:PAS domain S-box protein [Halorhabdus salina]